jgi:hypothetical protein
LLLEAYDVARNARAVAWLLWTLLPKGEAMKSELESITPILDTRPDTRTELQDRKNHRARLADYFRAHPGEDVEQDELERLIGRGAAITQRVRELATDPDEDARMNIVSVPTYLTDTDGRKHRLRNRYRYVLHTPLGRDASDYREQSELFDLR